MAGDSTARSRARFRAPFQPESRGPPISPLPRAGAGIVLPQPMSNSPNDVESAGADAELHRIRHSLAHVLAQAVLELRPGATLGFGPAIDDGFYYDFVLPEPLSEDDLQALEKKMKHI